MRIGPAPAGVLLGCVAAAALLADRIAFAAALTAALLAVILRFGPPGRRRLYLFGALWSGIGVLVVWPFLTVVGSDVRVGVRPESGQRTHQKRPPLRVL